MGDLNAQLAACKVGARRLGELCARLRRRHARRACFEQLLDRSEAMTRDALRQLPEGTYRYVDYLDNDGVDLDRRVRIEVAVDGARRHDPLRLHRHRPPAARAAQLRAVRLAGRRVLRGARADRCADPDQRRLLPAGDAAPARGLARQSAAARAGQCAHGHHQAHLRRDGRAPSPRPMPERVPGGVGGPVADARVRRQARRRPRPSSSASWSRPAPARARTPTASTACRPTARTA